MQFEKLYNDNELSRTPTLGHLGIRKDTFLKGILKRKCTQNVPNGPAHIAGARLCRAASGEMRMPPPRESRGATVSELGVT